MFEKHGIRPANFQYPQKTLSHTYIQSLVLIEGVNNVPNINGRSVFNHLIFSPTKHEKNEIKHIDDDR